MTESARPWSPPLAQPLVDVDAAQLGGTIFSDGALTS